MSDLEKSMANVVSAVGDIGKEIRKQAFLEAADTVENMSSGKVAGFKTVKETWQTIVETLREKAEECE